MFVAAAKVILDFYGNEDLSTKRQQMKKLAQDIQQKKNVSASEIFEKLDDPERCVLGLSLVASSHVDARADMDKVLKFVDSIAFARVTVEDVDVIQFE